MIDKKNVVRVIVSLLVGGIIATTINIVYWVGIVGGLNTELATSRDRAIQLERNYSELKQSNLELGKRLDSIQARITEAKGLVSDLSRTGASALETVRRVIENLTRLKGILEGKLDSKH